MKKLVLLVFIFMLVAGNFLTANAELVREDMTAKLFFAEAAGGIIPGITIAMITHKLIDQKSSRGCIAEVIYTIIYSTIYMFATPGAIGVGVFAVGETVGERSDNVGITFLSTIAGSCLFSIPGCLVGTAVGNKKIEPALYIGITITSTAGAMIGYNLVKRIEKSQNTSSAVSPNISNVFKKETPKLVIKFSF